MGAFVTMRRTKGYAWADCVTCGEKEPSGDDRNHERQRRWARRHAAENPGHSAHVVFERTTVYAADA